MNGERADNRDIKKDQFDRLKIVYLIDGNAKQSHWDDLIKMYFNPRGFQVTIATSLEELDKAIETERPYIIITDTSFKNKVATRVGTDRTVVITGYLPQPGEHTIDKSEFDLHSEENADLIRKLTET